MRALQGSQHLRSLQLSRLHADAWMGTSTTRQPHALLHCKRMLAPGEQRRLRSWACCCTGLYIGHQIATHTATARQAAGCPHVAGEALWSCGWPWALVRILLLLLHPRMRLPARLRADFLRLLFFKKAFRRRGGKRGSSRPRFGQFCAAAATIRSHFCILHTLLCGRRKNHEANKSKPPNRSVRSFANHRHQEHDTHQRLLFTTRLSLCVCVCV